MMRGIIKLVLDSETDINASMPINYACAVRPLNFIYFTYESTKMKCLLTDSGEKPVNRNDSDTSCVRYPLMTYKHVILFQK